MITGYKNGETTLILPKFQILAFDITSWQTKGHQYYFWPFSSGRDTAYNVTVINPLRRNYMEGSVENPGYGVQQAYKTKWNLYGPACEREGMNFVPLPVDVFGAWHKVAIKHLKKLGVTLARATCRDDSTTIQHLFQRLGILLVKGNVNLILNRIPRDIQPEINGIL